MYRSAKAAIRIIACVVFLSAILTALWYVNFVENRPPEESAPLTSETDMPVRDETPDADSLPAEETVTQQYVLVKKATVLRAKAKKSSDSIASLSEGDECVYLSEDNHYYKVRNSDKKTGWLPKADCELTEKDVIIRHIPKKPSETPYAMADTKEGADLDGILDKYGTVGASVAVIKDGQVAYHYEYGYANKEDLKNPVYVTEDTKFRVASISKVFTAMLAIAEADDGKLDLDGNLSELFGFNFYNPKYPRAPVTMRMLLTHTAGLSGKEGLYSKYIGTAASYEDYYFYKPGNGYYYSNLGMGLAGAAVEKAANQTISQYARDRFFAPMGIDASYDASYLSDKSLVADCYTNGRQKRSNEVLTRPQERANGRPGEVYHLGQGGLLISSVDLAKVSSILLNEGKYDGVQYLSPASVKEMLTVHPVDTKSNYEQCIGIRRYPGLAGGRDLYYHTGNYYGIYAVLAIDPSDGSGAVVITSGATAQREDNTVFNVCNDVLNYCYGNII